MEYLNKVVPSEQVSVNGRFQEIIGSSPALKLALAEVELVAPTDSTVLILGETGTGKELIAQAIHDLSTRRERPFLKLNCAAIPFDLLESDQGRIICQEVGLEPDCCCLQDGLRWVVDGTPQEGEVLPGGGFSEDPCRRKRDQRTPGEDDRERAAQDAARES